MGRFAGDIKGDSLETAVDFDADQRSGKRVNRKTRIRWTCFNPNIRCDAHDAEMVNFSEGGMYFETDFFSKIRPLICIKVKRATALADGESAEWLRSVQIGKVKWWREIEEGERSRFGVGVQYFR